MNTIQLLKSSSSQLQERCTFLQKELEEKKNLLNTPYIDEKEKQSILTHMRIIETELEVINLIWDNRSLKPSENLSPNILEKKLHYLESENNHLRNKLLKYNDSKRKFVAFIDNVRDKQKSTAQMHSDNINNDLIEAIEFSKRYATCKPGKTRRQKVFSRMCHSSLESSKKRCEQIKHIQNLANFLRTGSSENFPIENFEDFMLNLSIAIGLGFCPTPSESIEDMHLNANEKMEILSIIRSLTLYGCLDKIEKDVKKEVSFAPSRLVHLIKNTKEKLKLDIYNISDGVITGESLGKKSFSAYENFINLCQQNIPESSLRLKNRLFLGL